MCVSPARAQSSTHNTSQPLPRPAPPRRFAIGAGCLLWGPVSDRWGRRWCLYVSSVLFLAFTVGCIFSHDIGGQGFREGV
jgi:hypothetical protein